MREVWLAGRCPCCGMPLYEWEWNEIVYEPVIIAEGVRICGRCNGNQHMRDGVREYILEELLKP